MAMALTPTNLDRLPPEVWSHVFRFITKSSDLSKIMYASKTLYHLAVWSLYRNVSWTNPLHFTQLENTQFWSQENFLTPETPVSLTVSISYMLREDFQNFDSASILVEPNGHTVIKPVLELGLPLTISYFASTALYEYISRRIQTFTSLRKLVFCKAKLPNTVYDIIESLPSLRDLTIEYCAIPPKVYRPRNAGVFSSLPITTLTLTCLRSECQNPHPIHNNYMYLLHLATATNIRSLKIDWFQLTAYFFARLYPDMSYTLPTSIETLELSLPPPKYWPTSSAEANTRLLDPLAIFLQRCTQLRHLRFANGFARQLKNLPTVFSNLTSFYGPKCMALPICSVKSQLQHVEITCLMYDAPGVNDLLQFLPILGSAQPGLKSLSLRINNWDRELMFAITQDNLFPKLEELKIKYDHGCPSEYHLLSLSSNHLYRLPLLRVLHLYNPLEQQSTTPANAPRAFEDDEGWVAPFPSPVRVYSYRRPQSTGEDEVVDLGPGAAEDDDEVRELIVGWQKGNPSMREVKFAKGCLWRRAGEGDVWTRREVEAESASG